MEKRRVRPARVRRPDAPAAPRRAVVPPRARLAGAVRDRATRRWPARSTSSLGVVADHALGLTPLVFLLGGVFFVLTAMTYVEGTSLHQERGGATVFARYAFNELWSFVAGWAILLDYLILIAMRVRSRRTTWRRVLERRSGTGWPELAIAVAVIVFVAVTQHRAALGASRYKRRGHRLGRRPRAAGRGSSCVGAGARVRTSTCWLDSIAPGHRADLGRPSVRLDAGDGRAHRPRVRLGPGRRGARWAGAACAGWCCRARWSAILVSTSASRSWPSRRMPVVGGDELAGAAASSRPRSSAWSPTLEPALAVGRAPLRGRPGVAAVVLVGAATAAMLGLSRLGYSLATNRQIPSALGPPAPDALDAVRASSALGALLAIVLVMPARPRVPGRPSSRSGRCSRSRSRTCR